MVSCLALDCTNHSKKRKDLLFYKLPLNNEELLSRWLRNLRKPKLPPHLDNCHVCSDHFELDCFGRDLKAELLGGKPKPPLTTDAVPTLFLYNDFKGDQKRRVFSEQRKIRKEKEQTLKELLGPEYHNMKLIPPHLVPEVTNEDVDMDDRFSIQSLIPGFGHISEVACQTDNKPTTEMSCQAKPCLVSTGTQWDEKDFLPDPQVIDLDHNYCLPRFASVACQVETLSDRISKAAKSRTAKTFKTVKRSSSTGILVTTLSVKKRYKVS